jgi:hypothetical protein
MGSIDGYKFPDRDAEEVVEIADVLVNKHGGEATSKEKFAQDLGHSSAKSGTFHQKIADARKFGILPSRGLEAQELAYDLANPRDDSHENEARFRMYQNIPILNRLYSHLDGDESPPEFWRILTEITDANPKDAKDTADEIEELYREMLLVEPPDNGDEKPKGDSSDYKESQETEQKTTKLDTDGIYIKVGNNTLSLDSISSMNLKLAQTMLKQMEEQVKHQNAGDGVDAPGQRERDDAHGDGLNAFTE